MSYLLVLPNILLGFIACLVRLDEYTISSKTPPFSFPNQIKLGFTRYWLFPGNLPFKIQFKYKRNYSGFLGNF